MERRRRVGASFICSVEKEAREEHIVSAHVTVTSKVQHSDWSDATQLSDAGVELKSIRALHCVA